MFDGFISVMDKGGPVMWMLLICSIVVIAIVIERLIFFASQHSDTKGLLRQIGQKIAADDLDGAIKICQNNKGMLPRILEFGLRRGDFLFFVGDDFIENAHAGFCHAGNSNGFSL